MQKARKTGHEGNEMKGYFKIYLIIRKCYASSMKTIGFHPITALLLVLPGILGIISCGSPPIPTATELTSVVTDGSASAIEDGIAEGINRYRGTRSKRSFQRHAGLDNLARLHAQEMLQAGKMSHDGFHLRTGMAETYYGVGALHENVFWGKGFPKSQLSRVMVDGWVNSPGHRRNLLAPTSSCGVGVALGEDGLFYATQLSGSKVNNGGSF